VGGFLSSQPRKGALHGEGENLSPGSRKKKGGGDSISHREKRSISSRKKMEGPFEKEPILKARRTRRPKGGGGGGGGGKGQGTVALRRDKGGGERYRYQGQWLGHRTAARKGGEDGRGAHRTWTAPPSGGGNREGAETALARRPGGKGGGRPAQRGLVPISKGGRRKNESASFPGRGEKGERKKRGRILSCHFYRVKKAWEPSTAREKKGKKRKPYSRPPKVASGGLQERNTTLGREGHSSQRCTTNGVEKHTS